MTIVVRADDLAELDDGVAEAQAALADIGIIAVREDIALEPAFWAQFPGNFKYIARRGADLDRPISPGFASCHNFPLGQPAGNHWGERSPCSRRPPPGPIIFNFHQGDLGNFTVIGPSGSGKTVVLNFLLAQARKFGPRIIFFDKDRGAELFIRAIGGRYDVLRPGEPDRPQPAAARRTTPVNRQFLIDWLALLAGGADSDRGAGDDQGRGRRQFRAAGRASAGCAILPNCSAAAAGPSAGDLWSRLEPWWGDGERAWLFDNDATAST